MATLAPKFGENDIDPSKLTNLFFVCFVGGIFVGALFGRTCWTCLNPPLWKGDFRQNVSFYRAAFSPQNFFTTRTIILFSEKKNGWWGDPFSLKFWVKLAPLERNRWFLVDICSKRVTRNTWQKSSVNTNSMSTIRGIKMNVRWTKTQNGRFSWKIALRLKKVCYKVRDLRSFEIRFDFESIFRFGIRFVVMIRFEIFESSAPSIVLCKETIGGG